MANINDPQISQANKFCTFCFGYDKSGQGIFFNDAYSVYKFFIRRSNINTIPLTVNTFSTVFKTHIDIKFNDYNIVRDTKRRTAFFRGLNFLDPSFQSLAEFIDKESVESERGIKKAAYLYARCVLFLV